MTRFPQGAAGEQVFPQRRLQGSFVMLKTHTQLHKYLFLVHRAIGWKALIITT